MRITRSHLKYVLMVAVSGCLLIRIMTLGLLGLLISPLYLIVCAVHAVAHFRLLKRRGSLSRAALATIFVSHSLLLLAFLAQYDMGDDFGWFAAVALVRGIQDAAIRSEIWEENPIALNVLVFLPVGISWLITLFIRPKRTGKAV
jgi:hypothetical protein